MADIYIQCIIWIFLNYLQMCKIVLWIFIFIVALLLMFIVHVHFFLLLKWFSPFSCVNCKLSLSFSKKINKSFSFSSHFSNSCCCKIKESFLFFENKKKLFPSECSLLWRIFHLKCKQRKGKLFEFWREQEEIDMKNELHQKVSFTKWTENSIQVMHEIYLWNVHIEKDFFSHSNNFIPSSIFLLLSFSNSLEFVWNCLKK